MKTWLKPDNILTPNRPSEEIERNNEAEHRLKHQKKSIRTEKLAEENWIKLAEANLTENAILKVIKEKSSSIGLLEESLAGI